MNQWLSVDVVIYVCWWVACGAAIAMIVSLFPPKGQR